MLKNLLFKNFFFVRIVLFKSAQKFQNSSILRGKFNQNLIFWTHVFVQNLIFKNHFLKQNLTRCKIFGLKSDTLWKFCSKIWRVVKNLIWNLTRCKNVVLKPDQAWNVLNRNLIFTYHFVFFGNNHYSY